MYDELSRPRVVLCFAADEPIDSLTQVMTQFTDSVEVYASNSGWGPSLRWESWDAAIAFGDVPRNVINKAHLRVLQFGGSPPGAIGGVGGVAKAVRTVDSYGTEIYVPESLEEPLKGLVKSDLLQRIRDTELPRQVVPAFKWERDSSWTTVLASDLDGAWHSAIYKPDRGPAEVVFVSQLPTVEEFKTILQFVLDRWSNEDPERFPPGPGWSASDEWMLKSERQLARSVDDLRAELAATTTRLNSQIAHTVSELQAQRAKVDEAERILLTAQGDLLVTAVERALLRLGFDVENRDVNAGREKLEDLRVRTVHEGKDWLAIAEVKGHSKGGTPTDLQKLGRFVERYIVETRTEPNARWYIVNQFKGRNPSTRPVLLRGQDADVDVLAEGGGLAIDTRDLFRLWRDVDEGLLAAEDARHLLVSSAGRFMYPST